MNNSEECANYSCNSKSTIMFEFDEGYIFLCMSCYNKWHEQIRENNTKRSTGVSKK